MTTDRGPRRHGWKIAELDGLRAVAIGLVMLYHLWPRGGAGPVAAVIDRVALAGWAGVDVFFVLSGFLITRVLLASRGDERRWRSFYTRRGLRIIPLYYAVLTAVLVAGLAVDRLDLPIDDPNLAGVEHIWVNYLYLSNLTLAAFGSNWAPLDISWSLAVEEQFYLIYPLLVWSLSERRLLRVLVGAVIAAAVFRGVVFELSGENLRTAYALPLSRMDQLAMGGIALLLVRRDPERAARWARRLAAPLVAAAAALLLTLRREDLGFVIAGYFTTGAASAAVMVAAIRGQAPRLARVLRARLLVWVGSISYGLYLLHLIAAALVDAAAGEALAAAGLAGSAARLALSVALSLALAQLSWAVLERPILGLKDRWAPRSPPPSV